MKMATFKFQGFPSYLAAISLGGAIVIGFTLLSQWTSSKGTKKVTPRPVEKKKRAIIIPPWAITKADYLKAPKVSRKQLAELNERRPPEEWNTVIFFPTPLPNRPEPFHQFKKYFEAAKISIHICMFVCSLPQMTNLLLDKYAEGLIVLIVTDYDSWTAHNNLGFKILAGKGIQVKLNTSDHLIHNKFSVIDDEAVLTGSLNWTKQGVRTNNENVAVSTDPRIVSKYAQEFDRLWEESKSVDDADADAEDGRICRVFFTDADPLRRG